MSFPTWPDAWADAVIVDVRVRLGWWERFKALCGGELHFRVETRTEHLPGRVLTPPIEAHVARPRWWPRPRPEVWEAPR